MKQVQPEELAKRKYKLAFVNGCFDVLHPGHLELLSIAKATAKKLVVAINSDESVRLLGKAHPLCNDAEFRMAMLAGLADVDFVCMFDEPTPWQVIGIIRPDVLVTGAEYENPIGAELVPLIVKVPRIGSYSTSSQIQKIRSL